MTEETGPTLKDLFFGMMMVVGFAVVLLVSAALMPDCQNAVADGDRERINRECM